MYISLDIIIKAAQTIGAIGAIGAILIAVYKFVDRQKKQDIEIANMKEEQCLLTYGVLACLKGLKEQGCNGPVTEAIGKIEKHLNQKAHDQSDS